MMAEVGFDKDVAIAAAGALTEEVNERFGDCLDPAHTLAALKRFFDNDPDLKCRSCGWRKKGTEFCTMRQCVTGNGESCKEYRHVFNVVSDR